MATFNYKVKITNDHGSLVEALTAKSGGSDVSVPDIKRRRKRDDKKEYRQLMKDPSRYGKTHMADPDHLTLVMSKSGRDEVIFVYSEPFIVYFLRDPEVDDDPSAPDAPFVDGGNNDVIVATAQLNSDSPVDERFVAGPFTVKHQAHQQKFYKYTIQALSGLSLDPCIVLEP